jgi:hypothetical protein
MPTLHKAPKAGWNFQGGGIRILLIVAPPTTEHGADIHHADGAHSLDAMVIDRFVACVAGSGTNTHGRRSVPPNALLAINARIVGQPEAIQEGLLGGCRTLQQKERKVALMGLFPHL